ncbi:TPA: hypothetical protein ACWPZR_004732, partial [Escherichia coli]|uniref:hypothetical protein n=1 Tax=Escherichia coli TaxID=562 RepID=UPI0019BDD392|nr:hypothetical protein [Escherichia coli]
NNNHINIDYVKVSKYGKQQICTLRSFFICDTFCFMLCVGIIFIKIFTDKINPPKRVKCGCIEDA